MKRVSGRTAATALLAAAGMLAGCATSGTTTTTAGPQQPVRVHGAAGPTPAEQARADGGRQAYTAADVAFMQGMIAHHAQALVMTALVPTRAAAGSVRTLAERIDVGQRDEIAFMQAWLRERGEPVPEPAAAGHGSAGHATPAQHEAGHGIGDPAPHMPGMLTAEQLAQLSAATGADFDRLFLAFMIQHHEGALTMVEQLFASPGAGQDVNVFRFASDVTADQETEIARMQAMLDAATP